MADANQQAADKLNQETAAAQAAQQANADKTWANLHSGKIQPPTENDMSTKPVVKKAKGGKVRGHGIEKRGITKGKFI
jgi:hypothetical protein